MIVVIDYGIGNLASIINAFKRLKIQAKISSDILQIKKADALILPGVGAAGEGMKNLKKRNLDALLVGEINRGKPFLGICLGMQLLFEKSEEGNVQCLGIFKGEVRKFRKERKTPQIGWNQIKYQISNIKYQKAENLFRDIPDGSNFYFINSYYCLPKYKALITAETVYGEKFPSIVMQKNIVATQFHPEKSGKIGMQFLQDWRNLC